MLFRSVQKALGELRDNRDFIGDLGGDTLSNSATFNVEVIQLSSFLKRVIATGRIGTSVKRLEVIVNVDSAFESAINAGGDVILDGKPRIASEGEQGNGNDGGTHRGDDRQPRPRGRRRFPRRHTNQSCGVASQIVCRRAAESGRRVRRTGVRRHRGGHGFDGASQV